MAAEDTEASLKGLPNAKTTRYIEMGKSEMEVSEGASFQRVSIGKRSYVDDVRWVF